MGSFLEVLLPIILATLFVVSAAAGRQGGIWDGKIVMPIATDEDQGSESAAGVRWAVLLAGSAGYGNYRHQVVLALPATPIQEYLKLLLSEFCFFKSWYPLFFIWRLHSCGKAPLLSTLLCTVYMWSEREFWFCSCLPVSGQWSELGCSSSANPYYLPSHSWFKWKCSLHDANNFPFWCNRIGMFSTGRCMPRIPDTEKRRVEGWEHHCVHVWWYCIWLWKSISRHYHQQSSRQWCLPWSSQGLMSLPWRPTTSVFSHSSIRNFSWLPWNQLLCKYPACLEVCSCKIPVILHEAAMVEPL